MYLCGATAIINLKFGMADLIISHISYKQGDSSTLFRSQGGLGLIAERKSYTIEDCRAIALIVKNKRE